MPLRIQTNASGLDAQRVLARVGGTPPSSADAPARRISTEVMDSLRAAPPTTGADRALAENQAGLGATQSAAGGLSEARSVLGRMRELAALAADGSSSDQDRSSMQMEATVLRGELDRIAADTRYAGTALLDGSDPAGAGIDVRVSGGSSGEMRALADIDLRSADGARAALGTIDASRSRIDSFDSAVADRRRTLEVAANNITAARTASVPPELRIRDAEVAQDTSALLRDQILAQPAMALLAQANQNPASVHALLR